MSKIELPGIVYSLLLAVGAWAVDYFTTGDGSGIPWAPILVAAVPIILKSFSVSAEKPAPVVKEEVSGTRGMATYESEQEVQSKSKLDSLLWG